MTLFDSSVPMKEALRLFHELPNEIAMAVGVVVLSVLTYQLRFLSRPPLVPLKKLPKRPILSVQFHPDDPVTEKLMQLKKKAPQTKPSSSQAPTATPRATSQEEGDSDLWSSTLDLLPYEVDLKDNHNNTNNEAKVYPTEDDDEDGASTTYEIPILRDLPDSFAPLLSSSHLQVETEHVPPDLIHTVDFDATIRLQNGMHEIPLNKEKSRPQFRLVVPDNGCRLSVAAKVQSGDGKDLRQAMVEGASIELDPPLPLANVAPTLVHFPTLFEDRYWRSLRIVKFIVHSAASFLWFLEKCLWIVESHCQIHLSKVRIAPLCRKSEWRLQLSFSGHLLLWKIIPIPFIGVELPTFIIPQPYALLEKLVSSQPLASARLRREKIAEESIAVAVINAVESWNADLKVTATPPAVGVDIMFAGGLSCALELGLWRDPQAGRRPGSDDDDDSMSSWTTKDGRRSSMHNISTPFDANDLEPWTLEFSAKGNVSHEKLSVHVIKLAVQSGGKKKSRPLSYLATRGSFAVWRSDDNSKKQSPSTSPIPRSRKRPTAGAHPELQAEDAPSVAAVFLFPDETLSFHNNLRVLRYDFVFDVLEDSRIDAVTLSIGATHPMLKGGTMITTIMDTIFAYGTLMAREDSVIDPVERSRKRNILRHLPATNFTFGIQNVYIPPESDSYSDDGQSFLQPEMDGGRMILHFLGGMDAHDDEGEDTTSNESHTSIEHISDGIKLVADFEIPSLVTNSETTVKEFPELEVFEGIKLQTHTSGVIGGSINAHLRPQKLDGAVSTVGPNVFNPLEAYEIDFSKSSLLIKMREFSSTLGHRRVMFPAETTFHINVEESVVDMGFEGKTRCGLGWDFQGLSPILQVTSIGESPEDALPENKVQVSLLVSPLRQGRFSLCVSSVGGISITKAATSRDDKEGLYDWKFFNAIVSPDQGSMARMWDVLHDKRTVDKLLQIVKVINGDLFTMLQYAIEQVWRGKEILDQEGVSDPKHAIPMFKMARLVSLFLTGDVDQVDEVLPIMERVVDGDGLDTVKLKDLLRKNLNFYDNWAAEIDRLVRWAAVGLGPVASSPPYVEDQVCPLAELPQYSASFEGVPSAKYLYDTLLDKPQLPLDPVFSNLVSRVAPYLSFKQVEWILETRATTDWQPSDLRRIRYVFSIKRKVLEIAESYGGLSFLPQSFLLSVFIGEATRTSLRASAAKSRTKPSHRKLSRSSKYTRTRGRSFKGRSSSSTVSSASSLHTTPSTLNRLRKKRVVAPVNNSLGQLPESLELQSMPGKRLSKGVLSLEKVEVYELGDSLLGPADVAILLQAGLTSVMKSSTVVQLNQRMLLDLIGSQPRSFAVAVLAEIGTSPRALTSALMALLELDQTAFKVEHQIDVHGLLELWFPELKIPRREAYMAGGRWARQSYYDAVFSIATRMGDDAQHYIALKSHVQRVRHSKEIDPLPQPRCPDIDELSGSNEVCESSSKLRIAVNEALSMISEADEAGRAITTALIEDNQQTKLSEEYAKVQLLYRNAFDACARVLSLDKHAILSPWFRNFYNRNYDALMIKSLVDNVYDDVDRVRHWLGTLFVGSKSSSTIQEESSPSDQDWHDLPPRIANFPDDIFDKPESCTEQDVLDAIIEGVVYEESDRERLRSDPLVRMLMPNPEGKYNFVIVSAAGVVTEGKEGVELKDAFDRLKQHRGVDVIRADTATARSLDYNAAKVEEAIEAAAKLQKPFGLLGYSQGCANALLAESILYSGTPRQRSLLQGGQGGLVCRQLLFSAANGSLHGPAVEKKVHRLISMCEDFFKSQAGYCSSAFSSAVLENLNSLLDSAPFHKAMGSAQSFLPDGCRDFWREVQHLTYVPTCTLRGVMESHTTPESLEMMSHLLAKQSGSALHDSQVHVFDAVGYPVYHINRNGRLLRHLSIGDAAVQRTHHWSPLDYEVEFVKTARDTTWAAFDCAKDRHVFPWVEVNRRFGLIGALDEES